MSLFSKTKPMMVLVSLLIGLVLMGIFSGCGSQQPAPVVLVGTPSIGEPKVGAPSPQQPGEEIGISIEIASTGGVTLNYAWTADGGEIVRGQGSPAITYRVPEEPGTYNVRVKVEWEGQNIEKVTSIKVEGVSTEPMPETPTDTPEPAADTPTSKPTNTPKSTNTPRPPTDTPTPAPTNTPKPTNTPRPTPTPTATIDADPMVYDNFNNPANDGNLNQSQWYNWSDTSSQVVQQNGVLVITRNPKPDTGAGLDAIKYRNFVMNQATFFEAKLMMENSKSPESHVFIFLGSNLPTGDYSDCTLGGDGSPEQAWMACNYIRDGKGLYSQGKPVAYGTWHTVRIAVDPTTMTFSYYIDDQLIGSYVSTNAEELKNAKFVLNVGVHGLTPETFTGYIDDVRIGQLGQ